MKLHSYLILIIFYLSCFTLQRLNHVDGLQLQKGSIEKINQPNGDAKEDIKDVSEEDQSGQDSNGGPAGIKEKSELESSEKDDDSKNETFEPFEGKDEKNDTKDDQGGFLLEREKMEDDTTDTQSKDTVKEEDEKNELKKLEEFKKSETLENKPNYEEKEKSENIEKSEKENKYEVESEIISKTTINTSDVTMTDENEFTIDHPIVNQVVNKIIQPSTDEKQLLIEMKDDFEPESGMDDSKQTKSVILTFDLSSEDLVNKISLISDSKLTITRYVGMNPQKVKITIVDPTVQLGSSQTRLSELSKYESMQFELNKKVPGKADIISLSEISNQIPVILQQHNTTTLRFLLEAVDSQTQFGILSNMEGVGPTVILELKPTVESNSTWMYTITGVAIIFVIIGVSIALYFQNKNKESKRIENMPLLNNKV
ncbi:uncharacterized protein cubi_01509 [Cryptosporidium ubiquitum]|uniref:Transmembrane protein n=1 Tax=Cryptosporidium ubiquitum TaxID=857276 RepID=A0A1J4MD60_9CRYT|nr:uncharacterized protein cubi_01509 [Cryptosporidium ubiquitum]OII72176.1 hypothetical protein cubi_01509 [Cryptosporidium ubiquitum]